MNFQKFQLFSVPLQGINLIEASAGTGKTYTIENLFTRLLLEKNLSIEKILVVTFTEAATEELRDRIRKRLSAAQIAFKEKSSENKELSEFLEKYSDHETAFKLLTNALQGFDESKIFTIHGFCRKTLQDFAFESGVLFDVELANDSLYLVQEIVEDFWRKHFYQFSQLFISYVREKGYKNPTHLLPILGRGRYIEQPFLKVLPESVELPQTTDIKGKEEEFSRLFQQTQTLWRSEKEDIKNIFIQAIENKQLNGQKYRKDWAIKWFKELENLFNITVISIKFFDTFEKFTYSKLQESTNKLKNTPTHLFFELCEQLLLQKQILDEYFEKILLNLKIQLFHDAKQALEKKKYWHNVQSFDDLLTKLYYALKGQNGENLAKLLRNKYPAALIDEFQDTDPTQYAIFKAIYFTDSQNEEYLKTVLFLIGDPKQAIYSFRGADVFTYLSASQNATRRYTLTTNWRSEPQLIQAVNAIFEKSENPFLLQEIPFRTVDSAQKPALEINGEFLPPLHILFARNNGEKPLTQDWAIHYIPRAIGSEIARLLNLAKKGQAKIGEKPLVAGNIAILVRYNKQAQDMQKALMSLNIPSVVYSRESIWDSQEVIEIERLLLAIAAPHDESLLKAALTTDLLGISANTLYNLKNNNTQWQAWIKKFIDFNTLWQEQSFIVMMTHLLVTTEVSIRLLSYPDGERRLTNVLHLIELLQYATTQQKLNSETLCTWLSVQRQQAQIKNEENQEDWQLRLESDEPRVKIVTIHRSKGLEYPLVFCPFIWDGKIRSEDKRKMFTFHDENNSLILDLKPDDNNRNKAIREERAENLRLFYVAITRAKHKCYLVWGNFTETHTSPPAHLLYSDSLSKNTEDSILLNTIENLAKESKNAITVSDLSLESDYYSSEHWKSRTLQERLFRGKIITDWKITSFTALTAQNEELTDRPDYDETLENTVIVIPQTNTLDIPSIFSFKRGAKAGIFFHELFEHLDFTDSDNSKVIKKTLENHGYDTKEWQETIESLVFNVLNTPLKTELCEFTLSDIPATARLNELEFFYPLQQVTSTDLQRIFTEYGEFEGKPLTFQTIHGFMKGYIDVVFKYQERFYIADYKSNFLGTDKQAYFYKNLSQVIAEKSYYLQYTLYTVAVHRYLSKRLQDYDYQTHFGGVFYFFLRGMNPDWGENYGVYYKLPNAQLIEKLSNYF